MEQEDQQQQEDVQNSTGSKNDKKGKQKKNKIPQRGLGVAVLERMRLEEQNMRHTSFLPISSTRPSPAFNIKPAMPITSGELFNPLTPPPSLAPSCPASDTSFLPLIMWKGMNHGGHDHKQVQLLLPQPLSSQVASNMTNVSSSPSSSGVHLQVEFPSNQMHFGGNSALPWPDEERMVGMKRPLPFSLDNPPSGASSPLKLPVSHWPGKLKLEPPATCSRPNQINLDPSSSSTIHCNEPTTKTTSGNNGNLTGCLDGAFLTLAPPKQEQHAHYEVSFQRCQEGMEERLTRPLDAPQVVSQQQTRLPFYTFLPAGPSENDPRVVETEDVDLNLKL